MSAFKFFDKQDLPYNPKLVNKYILIIQNTSDETKKQETILLLFINMKKVVLKNVGNYLSLINNSGIKQTLEADELKTEAFIILSKCLEKYRVAKANNFYFYFNKSLSRNFYRMFQKEVRKNTSRINDITLSNLTSLRTNINLDSMSIVVDLIDLDDTERLIVESKIANERKEDFLEFHKDISTNTYYNCIKSIKAKLQILINEGEL